MSIYSYINGYWIILKKTVYKLPISRIKETLCQVHQLPSSLPGEVSPVFRLTCACVTQRESSGEAVSLGLHPVSSYSVE